MELLNFLSQVPIPVLILVIAVLVVVTAVVVYQYAKAKGLDGIRKEVYKLFLHAEHIYKESGQGEQKLKWVVQQARGLLPKWLQVIMSEEVLLKIIDWWFKEVLWSSIFVTLMANKIGGLQFGIYRNCQISSRVFHTAVAALPLTKANRSDFE